MLYQIGPNLIYYYADLAIWQAVGPVTLSNMIGSNLILDDIRPDPMQSDMLRD